MKKRWAVYAGMTSVVLGGLYSAGWLWVLLQGVSSPLARFFPWPIACSSHGCVSSRAWSRMLKTASTFAQATEESIPTPAVALTTLVRNHLVTIDAIDSSVTLAEATKYRQTILQIRDEQVIGSYTGLSATAYDEEIVLPFLRQEALRQQRKNESTQEMFEHLASEYTVVVLPRGLRWDTDKAEVVEK